MVFLFGLGSILYFSLLLTNAIAILSHDRFLVPLGLTSAHFGGNQMPQTPGYGAYDAYGGNIGQGQQEGPSIKERLVGLMGAVRTLMRIPLIPINIVVIVYELLLG